jgi:tRNA-splicing ligase RtcB
VIDTETDKLKSLLVENTYFGIGCTTKSHFDSSLFDSKTWGETKVIRGLKG